MIRTLTVLIAIAGFGCSATPTHVAHSDAVDLEQRTIEQRRPYAEAFVAAFQRYEADVARALTVEYSSEDSANAVIQSMTAQRFDGLLDVELERRGHSREDFADFLAQDEAFFSSLRANYHGRIDQLATQVTQVRGLVVVPSDPMLDELEAESAPDGRVAELTHTER
jgi:hypothetical protein